MFDFFHDIPVSRYVTHYKTKPTNYFYLLYITAPEGCPYVEDDEYTVTVKGSVSSLKGGCAYIHYNASDKLPQTYSLWFGNSHHDRPHCSNNGTYEKTIILVEYRILHCAHGSMKTFPA